MTQPVKPFASIAEQVATLSERGLAVDPQTAEQWLRAVGYYRLSGYWYPYRQLGPRLSKRPIDRFIPGATFDEVVRLYEFDRKLRTLIHDGVERIEVALRSHVSYVVGERDPLAHHDASFFRSTFDHGNWLTTARHRAERARRHSEPIKHHEREYGGRLPIWVLTEVLDFSDVSKLYDGMRVHDQWTIAQRLGVHVDDSILSVNQRKKALKTHPLARWFEHLTVLRNTCAHHSRVWNRSFTPVGTAGLRTIDELGCLPEGQSERVFGALSLMGYLLQRTSPGTTWCLKVRSLVEESFLSLPDRRVAEMGFPERWRQESLWSNR